MIIKSYEEYPVLIDIDDKKINKKLKARLEGKRAIHGDDYIDEEFYTTEVRDILIDVDRELVYIQEDSENILMHRLLSKDVISAEENGEMTVFTDEFRFKGKLTEIEKKWQQKITA